MFGSAIEPASSRGAEWLTAGVIPGSGDGGRGAGATWLAAEPCDLLRRVPGAVLTSTRDRRSQEGGCVFVATVFALGLWQRAWCERCGVSEAMVASLTDAPAANQFVRRGWWVPWLFGGVVGPSLLVGGALVFVVPSSSVGGALLGIAFVATYYFLLPTAWWTIRGRRLRCAGRASWRPAAGPCDVPLPVGRPLDDSNGHDSRPGEDEVRLLRGRAAAWVPTAHRTPRSWRPRSSSFHHGAGRPPSSACGILGPTASTSASSNAPWP